MPRKFQISELIDRAKKRSDQENSDELSALEWQQNLSTIYGEFYSLIVDSGMRYFETEAQIITNGSAAYAIPVDHLSTIAIDGETSPGGRRYALRESSIQERNRYTGHSSIGRASEFSLVGPNVELYPAPPSGTYYHTYIPQPADLTWEAADVDIDVITPDGEAFITWGLSVLAKAKEESDVRLDRAEREAARDRVREWALNRSFINPARTAIGDSDSREFYDPGGWWSTR